MAAMEEWVSFACNDCPMFSGEKTLNENEESVVTPPNNQQPEDD